VTDPNTLAARLSGAPDLYASLRALGAAAGPGAVELLPDLLRGCDDATRTRLASVDQGLLRAVLRKGAGGPAIPHAPALRRALAGTAVSPLFSPEIGRSPTIALLTNGEHPDMPAFSNRAFDAWFAAKGVRYGLGSYGERRSVYATAQFADAASPERRTVHTGIDVFAPAGTPLYAPLPGTVLHVTYNADPLDYGHTLIMAHELDGIPFFTLYGHLAGTLPGLLHRGQTVQAGQLIGHLGDWHENGGWAAHVHFQIMSDMLEQTGGNFFGVGHHSLWDVWQDICPDPNLLLRLPPDRFTVKAAP
jgi:murein DD-endopeptidase MepM/ murein hydrolase activator NlpD